MNEGQLNRIEQRQEALISGVAMMNETLGTHSEILGLLLQAATAPTSSDLADTLKIIAATLGSHTEQLVMIGRTLTRIEADLAAEV